MTYLIEAAGSGHAVPTGPGFDLVLVGHIVTVVVGFVAVSATGLETLRIARFCRTRVGSMAPLSGSLSRFFSPGPNVVGRTIYAIPVFGMILLSLSGNRYSLSDPWIVEGIALWVVIVAVGEYLLWPNETRIRTCLDRIAALDHVPDRVSGPPQASDLKSRPKDFSDESEWDALSRAAVVASWAAGVLDGLLIVGVILMTSQPR